MHQIALVGEQKKRTPLRLHRQQEDSGHPKSKNAGLVVFCIKGERELELEGRGYVLLDPEREVVGWAAVVPVAAVEDEPKA